MVTATATDEFGNTSEFSACAPVVPNGSVDLTVAVTGSPNPVRLGFPITYVITVTDNGPFNATSVRVTNTLPAGAVFSSATNSQGSFTLGDGGVIFNVGTLANGATATLAVTATLNIPGVNTNRIVATAAELDHSPGNNLTQQTATAGIFNLRSTLTAMPSPVNAGQTVTLIATVTNHGPDSVSTVSASIRPGTLTPGFDYVVASGPGTFSYSTFADRTTVIWMPGALAPGAGAQAIITGAPVRLGLNQSAVSLFNYSGFDTNLPDNNASVSTTVEPGPGIFTVESKVFVHEAAGPALVTVSRESGTNGTVTVQYITSPESATAPADYTHTTGTLTFTNGQTAAVVSIPIANDPSPECNETFLLRLFNPGGGAVVLSKSNAVVEIADNDFAAPPAVGVVAPTPANQRITPNSENSDFFFLESELWDMTPDGSRIAFVSRSPGLSSLKVDDDEDVFLHNRQTGQNQLVSISADGTAGGNDDSSNPGVSDNGRYVVFESDADNLTTGDTNNRGDIFLRDMQTGTTTLISVSTAGAQGDSTSSGPVMNATSHRIAFSSFASTLVAGDANSASDIFLRDLDANTTTLISVNTNGVTGNSGSFASRISSNGMVIAFESGASDLVPNDTNGVVDVFVRNLQSGTTTLVSLGVNNNLGNGNSSVSALSPDGRYVVFESLASNLATNDSNNGRDVFLRDLQTGTTTLISQNVAGTGPGNNASFFDSMTRDVRYIVIESSASNLVFPSTSPGRRNVYRYDRLAGTNLLVSVRTNSVLNANDDSFTGSVSEDGRYVAFDSQATDLVTGFIPGATFFNFDNVYLRDLQTETTILLSHEPGSLRSGFGYSTFPLISSNGQVVAFQSEADLLVFGDGNESDSDVFVYAASSNALSIVSAAASLTASRATEEPWVSRNGRYVTFSTAASELAPNDLNGTDDVFVRDVVSGTLTLLSGNSSGTGTASGQSTFPVMSQDARYIAFHSTATNITAGDTNTSGDIYLRDRVTGIAELISANSSGLAVGECDLLDLSADGRFVAFDSSAGNVLPGSFPGRAQVYVRDRLRGVTMFASVGLGGNPANGHSFDPLLSPTGWHVMFRSSATDLTASDPNGALTDVYLRDLANGTTRRVSGPAGGFWNVAYFSLDGRYLVFDSNDDGIVPGDSNGTWDVFVHNVFTGETILVSRNTPGPGSGNAQSQLPVISPTGRYVAFHSLATNLVAGDTNGQRDVFVRDMQTGVTRLVSVNCAGTSGGNAESEAPDISADGRFISFDSLATDLAPGDFSAGAYNVFLRDMAMNQTRLISVRTDSDGGGNIGRGAFFGSYFGSMSADASTIVFFSDADDLVANDNNLNQDLFFARPNVASPSADLAVSINAVPASPAPGANVTLTVTVQNLGPNTATNVTLANLIPSGLTFNSASVSQGSFSRTNSAVTAAFGNLASSAIASLTIQSVAAALGTHINTASVFSEVTDVMTPNNYASVSVNVTTEGGGEEGPALNVSRSGGVISIRWPSSATDFILQTKTNVAPAVPWENVTTGIFDDNTWKSFMLTNATDRTRFFRLIR